MKFDENRSITVQRSSLAIKASGTSFRSRSPSTEFVSSSPFSLSSSTFVPSSSSRKLRVIYRQNTKKIEKWLNDQKENDIGLESKVQVNDHNLFSCSIVTQNHVTALIIIPVEKERDSCWRSMREQCLAFFHYKILEQDPQCTKRHTLPLVLMSHLTSCPLEVCHPYHPCQAFLEQTAVVWRPGCLELAVGRQSECCLPDRAP